MSWAIVDSLRIESWRYLYHINHRFLPGGFNHARNVAHLILNHGWWNRFWPRARGEPSPDDESGAHTKSIYRI
jgi:hypothetical protein